MAKQRYSTNRTKRKKKTLNVATLNVKWINEMSKRMAVEVLANKDPIDVLCILETQHGSSSTECLQIVYGLEKRRSWATGGGILVQGWTPKIWRR